MAVPVRTTPALQLGQPVAQAAVPAARRWSEFDVAPDGQTFLAIVPEILAAERPLIVVLNWTAGLAK